MKNKIYPVLLVIFTMIMTSVTTSQAIPAQSTFYACVKKSSGEIKMTTASKKCTKGSTKINWNNAGAQGEAGPAGADAISKYSVVTLTPKDFSSANYWTAVNFGTPTVPSSAGWSKPVWTFEGSSNDYGLIQTSFVPPSDWENASSVRITFILHAADVSGQTQFFVGYGNFATGSSITTWSNNAGGDYLDTPVNEKIFEVSSVKSITSHDLVEVALWRFTDANDGDVHMLGARIEAID